MLDQLLAQAWSDFGQSHDHRCEQQFAQRPCVLTHLLGSHWLATFNAGKRQGSSQHLGGDHLIEIQ